ncbi:MULTISPECIES: TetR/AcrR family transcriptional regulator [Halomonadaceae]|uniref:TetR/AcrR family transcriptional regulator n=1 Tax=Halomonadaceae TaxID=28256 RepID=UPI001C27D8ED|nr:MULTISPECIES: TetR/AcrR family transcriptional regulator [unclassified Halomonas]
MPTTAKKKRPGRPAGQTQLREQILDAAEVLFAEQGYAGASLRHVAQAVDATTALITYYFNSKENLFREVFMRKGCEVADARMEALKLLQASSRIPTVDELVRAFLSPSIQLRKTNQGRAFLRLHSRLHMEPEQFSFELRRQVYDKSTHAYAKAFQQALPELDEIIVMKRMSFIIGAYLYAFSDTNRMDELIPNISKSKSIDIELNEIVQFATAGMLGATRLGSEGDE